MRILSAADALSPAFTRTRAVFFQPFRMGRSWKLAMTAYFSMMGCVFLPIPLLLLLLPWMNGRRNGTSSALFFVGFVTGYTAVMWIFFYIGARLQFVLFDIVLFKAEFVAPVWRKYRPQTWRWIGLKVVIGTLLSVIAGVPLSVCFIRALPALTVQPGQPPSPHMFGAIISFYLAAMGVMGLVFLLSSLLGDFVLPSIALEDASLYVAFRRFARLVEAEPGQMVLFLFFKIILGLASFVALEICTILMEIVLAIPLGIVAFLGWLVLHQLGHAGILMMTTGAFLLYILFFLAIFYFMFGFQGALITFFQAYALFFLGGRYPLLGDLLEPQSIIVSPAPFAPIPSAPLLPPAEPI